jgi:2-polyprenyl-6-hydroxyphenyl methylase/3-demethylubiquinone-9 3-methyltransferase
MKDYYARRLSADRLALCYEVAPPRVQQYLKAEIEFLQRFIKPRDLVLELGCGYGRALKGLVELDCSVVGIDTSFESIFWGKRNGYDFSFATMDASLLGFPDDTFDQVLCIQNGISAFKVKSIDLIVEALRVAKSGGHVIFSSYSDRFWNDRLDWFRIQSRYHLIGEIDYDRTCNGRIVCKDGFTANTFRPADFLLIASLIEAKFEIDEVDDSSVFFVIHVEG